MSDADLADALRRAEFWVQWFGVGGEEPLPEELAFWSARLAKLEAEAERRLQLRGAVAELAGRMGRPRTLALFDVPPAGCPVPRCRRRRSCRSFR